MTQTWSVWPPRYSEQSEVTLENIEREIQEGTITQAELNKLFIKQLKILNKHLEAVTDLQNKHLELDVDVECSEVN